MKKAQASQIFVYAIGVVIVGLVLLMGYKGITSITSAADTGAIEKFKNTFANDIDTGSSFGRQATRTYSVPGDFDRICFASDSQKGRTVATIHPLVADEIESGTENSVFLLTEDNEITGFPTEPLEMQGGSACLPIVNGKVKLKLNGKGDHTLVSAVS